jgi:hypothetical protein
MSSLYPGHYNDLPNLVHMLKMSYSFGATEVNRRNCQKLASTFGISGNENVDSLKQLLQSCLAPSPKTRELFLLDARMSFS